MFLTLIQKKYIKKVLPNKAFTNDHSIMESKSYIKNSEL